MAALIPLIVGAGLAGAAYVTRSAFRAYRDLQFKKMGSFNTINFEAYSNLHVDAMQKKFIGPFQPSMTQEEALLILGLKRGCTKAQLKEAHRRMMRVNHPDTGGSAFVASKVNQARDTLSEIARD